MVTSCFSSPNCEHPLISQTVDVSPSKRLMDVPLPVSRGFQCLRGFQAKRSMRPKIEQRWAESNQQSSSDGHLRCVMKRSVYSDVSWIPHGTEQPNVPTAQSTGWGGATQSMSLVGGQPVLPSVFRSSLSCCWAVVDTPTLLGCSQRIKPTYRSSPLSATSTQRDTADGPPLACLAPA